MTSGQGHSLVSGFRWLLAGSVATALSQWGALALVARWGTPYMLSAYAVALSIGSVAFALANLDLRTLQVTDHAESIPFSSYFRLRLLLSLLAVAASFAFGLFTASGFFPLAAILIVASGRVFESLSDVVYGRLQMAGLLHRIGLSQVFRAGLALGTLYVSLRLEIDALGAIAAGVSASMFIFVIFDMPGLRRLGIRFGGWQLSPSPHVGELIRAGGPLTLVAALVAAAAAMPRLVSARESDPALAGVVTALTYMAVAPNLIMTALGQAGMRTLAVHAAQGDRRGYLAGVMRLLTMAAGLGLIVVLGGLLAGPWLLRILYGNRFAGYGQELVYFLSAGVLSYLNAGIGYSLSPARIFRPQVPMMAVVCLVSYFACSAWIPRWGIAGAAAGWAAALFVQLLWGAVLVWTARPALPARREALSTI